MNECWAMWWSKKEELLNLNDGKEPHAKRVQESMWGSGRARSFSKKECNSTGNSPLRWLSALVEGHAVSSGTQKAAHQEGWGQETYNEDSGRHHSSEVLMIYGSFLSRSRETWSLIIVAEAETIWHVQAVGAMAAPWACNGREPVSGMSKSVNTGRLELKLCIEDLPLMWARICWDF